MARTSELVLGSSVLDRCHDEFLFWRTR